MRPLGDSAIAREGKILILAHDHGLEHGPGQFEGVEQRLNPERVFDIATHDAVTALAVGKGLAETYAPSYEDVPLLAKLNGTSNLWMGEPYSPQNWSVEHAAELGADAIGYTVYPGSNDEPRMFEEFRDVQEAARDRGLPVATWSYARGQALKRARTVDTVSYCARIGLELGADVVKVKYPGSADGMAEAVRAGGPVNVVMSGGSKTDDREFLEVVEGAIDAGASGLAVGRNVWKREDPVGMLDALGAVIFEGASADEAI